VGLVLILLGVYLVLSRKSFDIPKLDKAFFFGLLNVIIGTVFALLVKKVLFDVEPINLAIMMYFSTTLILLIYDSIAKRKPLDILRGDKSNIPKIAIAAFFGAIGTFLLYSALSIGDASKVYPIAGLQSVLIFIAATLFLKEKFMWHRMIGTIIVVAGIYLISI